MVTIDGNTKIEVKGSNKTAPLAIGVALVLMAAIIGFAWIETSARKSVRIPASGVMPLGGDRGQGMDSYLVYTKAGEYPVRIDVPKYSYCSININYEGCQELICMMDKVAQICRGGYIIQISGGK